MSLSMDHLLWLHIKRRRWQPTRQERPVIGTGSWATITHDRTSGSENIDCWQIVRSTPIVFLHSYWELTMRLVLLCGILGMLACFTTAHAQQTIQRDPVRLAQAQSAFDRCMRGDACPHCKQQARCCTNACTPTRPPKK